MADAELKDGPDGIDASVGRKIRERRKQLGISQIQLVVAIGVSYQQLQKYERGLTRVAASRLAATAAALDVPPGHFFVTEVPDQTQSRPHALDLTCLAAAQAASEAASELVRVTREGTPLPIGEVLARMVGAALVVAELKARPQDTGLLVAMRQRNAQHA